MATETYLIRHGQTAWSLTGQHTGRTDLPLTLAGESEAARLPGRLRGLRFAHVLTSPRLRARQTCDLAGCSAHAREDRDLAEWDYGDYEGLTTAAIQTRAPGWEVFRDGCPNGESVAHISARADRVIAQLMRLDGVVALFSHGQFLRSLAMRWIGLPVLEGRRFGLATASVSVLGYEQHNGPVPAVCVWNSVPASE